MAAENRMRKSYTARHFAVRVIFSGIMRRATRTKGEQMALPVRWRYKLERWRKDISNSFRARPAQSRRPRICPACGTLVGSEAKRCHQCGTSLTFSLAAASHSLSKHLPQTAPATYGIVAVCCLLYVVALLASIHRGGMPRAGGGLGALFSLGGIDGQILVRMGASMPLNWGWNVAQPWRFLTAVFLHSGLLHVGFNMWVLIDLGPVLEEIYGSARFLFIFVVTGISGFLLSSATGHFSVGASAGLLGLVGVILALTKGQSSMGMQMLRGQAVYLLIYVAFIGLMPGLRADNFAHIGGFASGFLLGKILTGRQPADADERRRAVVLGWTAGLAIAASFAFMLVNYFSFSAG